MNCPKCNHPGFYQGITSLACENESCDLYVKAQGQVSSREGADGTTVWLEGPSGSHPSSSDLVDVNPSESQDDTHPGQDWEALTTPLCSASQPTMPMIANTHLSGVHEDQSWGGQSQLLLLVDSLQSIRSLLEDQEEYLTAAKHHARKLGLHLDLRDIAFSLADLRATLQRSMRLLGQSAPSLHTPQSEDLLPSGIHKSEDTCQKETAPFPSDGAIPARTYLSEGSRAPEVEWKGCLSSNDSSFQPQSCETRSPESWEDYAHCTSPEDYLGFEKGLSLAELESRRGLGDGSACYEWLRERKPPETPWSAYFPANWPLTQIQMLLEQYYPKKGNDE